MILVVGGTGFIGRHLLGRLRELGRSAMTVSRKPDNGFLASHAPSISAMTVDEFYRQPDGVLDGCSAVVWLGSGSEPGQNVDAPWAEMHETVEPMLQMAHAVTRHNPAVHFVFISSGGTVYGNPEITPVPESAPLRPISAYGFGKVMSEQALTLLADVGGLRVTVLRPANPVGTWQIGDRQGIVAMILNCLTQKRPFPRMGDGEAVRDYFDVGDLCDAILGVIDQPDDTVGQTFNVGSGTGRSINDILAMVEAEIGYSVPIESRTARTVDVRSIILDTRKIEAAIGWRAKVRLKDTIRTMVEARLKNLTRSCGRIYIKSR